MRRFPAFFALLATAAGFAAWAASDDNRSLGGRTRQYLTDLIRLDTSNPPGNESSRQSCILNLMYAPFPVPDLTHITSQGVSNGALMCRWSGVVSGCSPLPRYLSGRADIPAANLSPGI